MDKLPVPPATLLEAVRYFADPDTCLAFMVNVRWPDGNVACPTCGRPEPRFLAERRVWQCGKAHPRRQFSVKVGTIFEDSPLGLAKWLPAVWMLTNDKNGISSYEVARALGITQKSAWFMLHRIREAMKTGSFTKMSGRVEADETFVGGLSKNMHKAIRAKKIPVNGPYGSKTIVMGLLNRGDKSKGKSSRVRAGIITDTQRVTLHAEIQKRVEPGSEVFTDAWRAYRGLAPAYIHEFVDHATAYVRGHVHTNGLENFWCLLKRSIKGTYVNVEPFHLHRYVDEQAFRFNERWDKDGGRFVKVLRGTIGRRLTYKGLTAAPA
jgi:transposase-like protein